MESNSDNTNNEIAVGGKVYTEAELNAMSEGEVMDLFVEQMMEDKGLTGLEPELAAEVKDDLRARLVFQINRAVIAELPDDKLEELERGLEGPAGAEVLERVVAESGVNVAGVTQRTMEEFRAIYLTAGRESVGSEVSAEAGVSGGAGVAGANAGAGVNTGAGEVKE